MKNKQRYAVREVDDQRIIARFELPYDRDLFIEALAAAQPLVRVVKVTFARAE